MPPPARTLLQDADDVQGMQSSKSLAVSGYKHTASLQAGRQRGTTTGPADPVLSVDDSAGFEDDFAGPSCTAPMQASKSLPWKMPPPGLERLLEADVGLNELATPKDLLTASEEGKAEFGHNFLQSSGSLESAVEERPGGISLPNLVREGGLFSADGEVEALLESCESGENFGRHAERVEMRGSRDPSPLADHSASFPQEASDPTVKKDSPPGVASHPTGWHQLLDSADAAFPTKTGSNKSSTSRLPITDAVTAKRYTEELKLQSGGRGTAEGNSGGTAGTAAGPPKSLHIPHVAGASGPGCGDTTGANVASMDPSPYAAVQTPSPHYYAADWYWQQAGAARMAEAAGGAGASAGQLAGNGVTSAAPAHPNFSFPATSVAMQAPGAAAGMPQQTATALAPGVAAATAHPTPAHQHPFYYLPAQTLQHPQYLIDAAALATSTLAATAAPLPVATAGPSAFVPGAFDLPLQYYYMGAAGAQPGVASAVLPPTTMYPFYYMPGGNAAGGVHPGAESGMSAVAASAMQSFTALMPGCGTSSGAAPAANPPIAAMAAATGGATAAGAGGATGNAEAVSLTGNAFGADAAGADGAPVMMTPPIGPLSMQNIVKSLSSPKHLTGSAQKPSNPNASNTSLLDDIRAMTHQLEMQQQSTGRDGDGSGNGEISTASSNALRSELQKCRDLLQKSIAGENSCKSKKLASAVEPAQVGATVSTKAKTGGKGGRGGGKKENSSSANNVDKENKESLLFDYPAPNAPPNRPPPPPPPGGKKGKKAAEKNATAEQKKDNGAGVLKKSFVDPMSGDATFAATAVDATADYKAAREGAAETAQDAVAQNLKTPNNLLLTSTEEESFPFVQTPVKPAAGAAVNDPSSLYQPVYYFAPYWEPYLQHSGMHTGMANPSFYSGDPTAGFHSAWGANGQPAGDNLHDLFPPTQTGASNAFQVQGDGGGTPAPAYAVQNQQEERNAASQQWNKISGNAVFNAPTTEQVHVDLGGTPRPKIEGGAPAAAGAGAGGAGGKGTSSCNAAGAGAAASKRAEGHPKTNLVPFGQRCSFESRWKSFANSEKTFFTEDPGVPTHPEYYLDGHKPRKQFKDYYYDSAGFIEYQKTFEWIISHYERRIQYYGTDEKLLNDIIVQLMKPLETDRPFEAFSLVWHFLKWLHYNQIEIKTKLFTLIIRSFEKTSEPQKYVAAMLDIYKRLPARNSHATAAMIKAHGVAQDVGQCLEYLKQYKLLPKHDSNKKFSFVVYQAALDASILHLQNKHRRLEAMARMFIYEEGVTQCDEPLTRRKIDPLRNPRESHPHLFQHGLPF